MAQLRIAPKGEQPSTERITDKEIGTDGIELRAAVNYIRVQRRPNTAVHEYHVRFAPDIDSIQIRRKIAHSDAVTAVIGNVMAFTGMNLFLPHKIENTEIETIKPTDGSTVRVSIEYVKQPPVEELIPFYNTLFRRIMTILKLVQINRHYYMPSAKVDIPQHKLEIWPGWVTAIQEHDGGLLLVCDASHRVLRNSTARDLLMQLKNSRAPDFQQSAMRSLVGCIVLTVRSSSPIWHAQL